MSGEYFVPPDELSIGLIPPLPPLYIGFVEGVVLEARKESQVIIYIYIYSRSVSSVDRQIDLGRSFEII